VVKCLFSCMKRQAVRAAETSDKVPVSCRNLSMAQILQTFFLHTRYAAQASKEPFELLLQKIASPKTIFHPIHDYIASQKSIALLS